MTPQSDVGLAPLCTLGVGGPARHYLKATSESDICAALKWADIHSIPVYVLGGGSNVVISDDGVAGLVIHVAIPGIEQTMGDATSSFRMGAGEAWDPVVKLTVDANCSGLECLSGIPGLVGGTPVQNVGAYGQDVSSTITSVHTVDRASHRIVAFSNAECAFGYRTSRFKHADSNRFIVTAVEFNLARDGEPTVAYADVVTYLANAGIGHATVYDVRDAVLAIRRRKGMVIEPGNIANRSCGSFFVNPVISRAALRHAQRTLGLDDVPHYDVGAETVKVPAAWLIEQAGFPKGTRRGAVGISPLQAQAIINFGNARAADVVALASEIKRAVWAMFGISIVPEPVFVGFPPSPEVRFLLTHERSH
jgi:UDP-N-acetylmuramate dehydrogenase